MDMRQKQVLDSFARIRSFLDATPVPSSFGYVAARAMLDDAAQRLHAHAIAQEVGRNESSADSQRQVEQIALIIDRFMRPIATIARAQLEPDAGLPKALRMPKQPISPRKLLVSADAMIEAARAYEALFAENDLPTDLLQQFQAARDALERIMANRSTQIGKHRAARKGLQVQLRRGRRAVERLDAVVRSAYRNDVAMLESWRETKRVHLVPGRVGTRSTAPSPVIGSVSGEEITEAAA